MVYRGKTDETRQKNKHLINHLINEPYQPPPNDYWTHDDSIHNEKIMQVVVLVVIMVGMMVVAMLVVMGVSRHENVKCRSRISHLISHLLTIVNHTNV